MCVHNTSDCELSKQIKRSGDMVRLWRAEHQRITFRLHTEQTYIWYCTLVLIPVDNELKYGITYNWWGFFVFLFLLLLLFGFDWKRKPATSVAISPLWRSKGLHALELYRIFSFIHFLPLRYLVGNSFFFIRRKRVLECIQITDVVMRTVW